MKRTVVLALAAVLSAAACSGKSGTAQERSASGLPMAPRLTGKDLRGEYVALSDFRGKVVLLNVWATWCGPCRQELPALRDLQRARGGEDFTVLGVSVDRPSDFPKVQSMAQRYQLDYPIVLDPAQGAVEDFDVHGYPTTFLIGRDGAIRWRRNGLVHPDDPELERQIEAALALPAPTASRPS